MRESNFAFPAQNRASVCITSQLYDRRALDTVSPLPLFNSLHHLTYLTSTSPRIREIMTTDGGLERLVRILHDFCLCPPPPENPNAMYGLAPPNSRPPKLVPTLNPTSYDKHAAYRFSLAFQCVVNIGVRGSEPIRSRVVQAGTLEVVGCILEAWLASKGFATGPSSSATGLPRESREQRQARKQALVEQRQREEAEQLTRALQRQLTQQQAREQQQRLETLEVSEPASQSDASIQVTPAPPSATTEISIAPDTGSASVMVTSPADERPYDRDSSSSSRETGGSTSAETSVNTTPLRSGTPTGAVVVNTRERSGTIIARPMWDGNSHNTQGTIRQRAMRQRDTTISPNDSTDNSRAETETEDDGDVDMDRSNDTDDNEGFAPPIRSQGTIRMAPQRTRRAVGIVSDTPEPAPTEVNADAHIIIQGGGVEGADGMPVGVEDGIVSLEQNDDFAMGAPPGAPGAMDETLAPPPPTRTPRGVGVEPTPRDRLMRNAPDATPRANVVSLPAVTPQQTPAAIPAGRQATRLTPGPNGEQLTTAATPPPVGRTPSHHSTHHHREDAGPYKDEDVLLSLQLLAYLSKYPHVRQAFYKPRASFHPAAVALPAARAKQQGQQPIAGPSGSRNTPAPVQPPPHKESHGLFRAFTNATTRGKEKEKEKEKAASSSAPASGSSSQRMTNVFSLVERFTFRPSSSESEMPNPPPRLPPEIQYWAGVIMRNACRKDESRGGIRQCANMLCGKWESYPREFAKCRRCRKAKYCGKECQSTAWSEGHRFWCSAKDGDDEADPSADHAHAHGSSSTNANVGGDGASSGTAAEGRADRRAERERQARERAPGGTTAPAMDDPDRTRVPPRGVVANAAVGPTNPVGAAAAVRPGQPAQTSVGVPRTSRTIVSAFRPSIANVTPAVGETQGARRRAETVSGATGPAGFASLSRADQRFVELGGTQAPTQANNDNANGPAPQAQAHERTLDGSTSGEHDMVLG
ncbi:hypothetical protein CONPUDRAFT_135786 [Coniophora puteana RWD-64-598 SS2]|uniref:MYND-type domain-containing protein n=1 Tax=Coniophora puteana (strain RWD-64-598) TaxID=741705 RepID=A0A5M3MZ52_CONPW|nr:uncharacterized protein CONPUDRAFT_135786 [Coniophora puteana RWD-64-598 SS2]EIW84287.1 hypothetical protein CONPUDRAFT_135786 [Coniophora puteana RWD-64-598 SS2]